MSGPALKMFVPGDGDNPADYSLRRAFDVFLKPELVAVGRAAGTLEAYATGLKHWEALTKNTPVGKIDRCDVEAFRDGLLEAGNSGATVRKYWAHLRAILRRLAPAETRNQQGEGIISRVPWMRLPAAREKMPRIASFLELNALYDACQVATWPLEKATSILPRILWRTFLVLAYNYGPRTKDLWRLTWAAVDWERESLRFQAKKTSKLQGLPLNDATRIHLRRIQPAPSVLGTVERTTVFHPTRGNAQFYREWQKINAAASLSVPMECRDLRETCASNYERIAPGVGAWILGHAARGVTSRFYLNPTPQVIDAVQKLPQPEAFLEPARVSNEEQLRLF
ncbi:MAG: tyrosine-type recombinase/integrase [Candidatus Sulfotelmatobacter sp.]